MTHAAGLKKVISLINKGTQVPALSLVRQNPETAAVISKLVRSRDPVRFDKNNENSFYNLDQSKLQEMSATIQDRLTDTENMMQLFPDLELAAQIMISSILSPKDMVNTEVIYTLQDNVLPAVLSAKIIDIIREDSEKKYRIKAMLPDILREMLFETGSYVKAVIPESSIDELINNNTRVTLEQMPDLFTKQRALVPLGILGNPGQEPKTRSALETFDNFQRIPYKHYQPGIVVATEKDQKYDLNIDITDNFMVLKLPQLIEANNRIKVREHLQRNAKPGFAFEAYQSQVNSGNKRTLNDRELETLLYKSSQPGAKPFVDIKTQRASKRRSVGRPLVMKIPSEATIPVHVPGDPKTHIGYFILIDEEGNPVTRSSALNAMGGLQSQFSTPNVSHSLTSVLLSRAKRNLTSNDNKNLSLDQAAKIYSDIVESDLVERLRNGIYGSRTEIAKVDDVYRIMMARTYANQYTRLVYIPVELVTYFAFKHYDNGVGKSMLDDLKILTSLRSILLFAKVMAMTKNSIALTNVNMTLDPNDPDPQKTIEMGIHEIIRMRQQYFPLGINSPNDLVDWIQRAGFEFTFEGHPGLPQTKFDFDTKNMNHPIPDIELDELLRKQTLMAIGLSPETVDAGFTAEFAVTVVKNNILLSKRVQQIQEIFAPQLTDNIQKIILNDNEYRVKIIEMLKANKASLEKILTDEEKHLFAENETVFYQEFYETIVNSLEVTLPKPDLTTLENQSQAFQDYSDALDKTIEPWINSDFMAESVVGELNGNIDMLKAAFKAYFLRKWMADNGFMTELVDIVSTDEDGHPLLNLYEIMKEHVTGLSKSSVQYIAALSPNREAVTTDINNLNVEPDETSTPTDTSESGDDGFGGGMDDFGGDFNMDDMGSMGGDETPSEESPPEETPPETKSESSDETPPIE